MLLPRAIEGFPVDILSVAGEMVPNRGRQIVIGEIRHSPEFLEIQLDGFFLLGPAFPADEFQIRCKAGTACFADRPSPGAAKSVGS